MPITNPPDWLGDLLFGYRYAALAGVGQLQSSTINFVDAQAVAINATTGFLDVTIGVGSFADVKIQVGAPAQELIGLYSGSTSIGSLFTWAGVGSGQTIWNAGQAFVPVIQGFASGVQYIANNTHSFSGGITPQPQGDPSTPTTNANTLYSGNTDGHLKFKNSSGTIIDLTTGTPPTFTQVQTALAAASGSISVNSQKITNLATPAATTDATTKAYVDAGDSAAVSTATAASVPTGRLINTTSPLVGGGALSGDLTLSIQASSGSQTGSMSATQAGQLATLVAGTPVTSVGSTSPISSSGGTTPVISILASSGSQAGSMSAAQAGQLATLVTGGALPTPSTMGNVLTSTGSAWVSQAPAPPPASSFLLVNVTLSAGTGTQASGHTLAGAVIVGCYLKTPNTAVGFAVPSISGNNVVVTSYTAGAVQVSLDGSTYTVVIDGWT